MFGFGNTTLRGWRFNIRSRPKARWGAREPWPASWLVKGSEKPLDDIGQQPDPTEHGSDYCCQIDETEEAGLHSRSTIDGGKSRLPEVRQNAQPPGYNCIVEK
jgi:hypothetical protein